MEKWYNESVFYHVYPLGFCGCPDLNKGSLESHSLNKVTSWLPHMEYLGINALYLGPVFESSSHGYDTIDYLNVDRRLGNNSDLTNLVRTAHNMGIKIVLDGVFNHVSRDFFAFRDLQENRENSRYVDWFKNVKFNPLTCDCWSGHGELVELNLKNSDVVHYLFSAIDFWVKEFDIDGLRLDVADVLDFDFMRSLSTFSKNVKEDFWLMGEVIHGDYSQWVNPKTLNSTTNYQLYKGIYSSHNDVNYFEVAHTLKRQFNPTDGIYKDLVLYNFLDNHDVDRIASILKNPQDLYTAHILLFTAPGVPSIYYGSEWGILGKRTSTSDKALRPYLESSTEIESPNKDLIFTIRKLTEIWKNNPILQKGLYNEVKVESDFFVFERTLNNKKIIVVINSSGEEKRLEMNLDSGTDLLNPLDCDINIIPAHWGRIINIL